MIVSKLSTARTKRRIMCIMHNARVRDREFSELVDEIYNKRICLQKNGDKAQFYRVILLFV